VLETDYNVFVRDLLLLVSIPFVPLQVCERQTYPHFGSRGMLLPGMMIPRNLILHPMRRADWFLLLRLLIMGILPGGLFCLLLLIIPLTLLPFVRRQVRRSVSTDVSVHRPLVKYYS
jgi:hypothetical protein